MEFTYTLIFMLLCHQERRRRLDEEKKAEKEIDRLKDEIEKLKTSLRSKPNILLTSA